MARKKIRIGVAGLGRIGWEQHCAALARHEDFALVAVADTLTERRQEAEQTYGVTAYGDFEEMLASARLDAVVVATPSHLHKPMTLSAFRAGCHVLVEKPMAVDGTEAAAMVRAAKRADRQLTVFQSERASARFQTLKRLLDSGVIGKPYHLRMGWYDYVRRNDWQSLRAFGGGMLNNYGAHGLDQLLQLCGYDVTRVCCDLRAVATLGDAEDVVHVTFETRSGVTGELDINQASPVAPDRWQVWGTHGAVRLAARSDEFEITSFSPEQLPRKALVRALASEGRQYPADKIAFKQETVRINYREVIDIYVSFAAAIRKGKSALLFIKPEESLALMKLIDRCRADSGGVRRVK